MANPETQDKEPFQLRSLAFSVYLPTILFSIGQGAAIPAIPLFARELGASVALAAFIVALRGIARSSATCRPDLPSRSGATRARWSPAPR